MLGLGMGGEREISPDNGVESKVDNGVGCEME